MMYGKAALLGDATIALRILDTSNGDANAGAVKRLGRAVKGFDPATYYWDLYARLIVEEACYQKFSQNIRALEMLLRTGDKVLVEAAPNDPVWGWARKKLLTGRVFFVVRLCVNISFCNFKTVFFCAPCIYISPSGRPVAPLRLCAFRVPACIYPFISCLLI